ncbi:MAG TPA: TRAM domain-containing protein, partial [Burkholderiales bacterium]|nr:TRAM domain-containing protein [Burkholderiales bacterium]
GFPGETESDFAELLDFIAEAQLDRVGCFAYSPIEGATANELSGAVPEAVKEKRLERFMAVQEKISAARLERKIGRELDVLIDEASPSTAVGRTQGDAPEIDGVVRINHAGELRAGEFARVRITGADAHDLEGTAV